MTDLSAFSGETRSSIDKVKEGLKKTGLSEKEIAGHLENYSKEQSTQHLNRYAKLNGLFGTKEFLDRIAYGFGATQFVTIFFFLSGASAFLVGIINGFKDLISGLLSAFFHQYSHVHTLGRQFIAIMGILFGFSFLGLVLGIRLDSPAIYAASVLLGSLGVVAYGELYMRLYEKSIPHERKKGILKGLTRNGLLITAVSFLAAGFIIERFSNDTIMIGTFALPLSGYFIVFESAAILFILAGFILSKIPDQEESKTYPLGKFLREYIHHIREQTKLFFAKKNIKLLYFVGMITTVLSSLGASFYGYYIYDLFRNQLFGGFMNIAIIFTIAIIISFIGPVFTRFVQKHAGLAPMFVFGTLLMAIMPLVLLYNQHFPAIVAASSAMVLGASTLGTAQGLLTRKLLFVEERQVFYQSQSLMLIIPFLILVPLGAYIADAYSFELLFRIMLYVLVGLVAPIYFTLVILSNKNRT